VARNNEGVNLYKAEEWRRFAQGNDVYVSKKYAAAERL